MAPFHGKIALGLLIQSAFFFFFFLSFLLKHGDILSLGSVEHFSLSCCPKHYNIAFDSMIAFCSAS